MNREDFSSESVNTSEQRHYQFLHKQQNSSDEEHIIEDPKKWGYFQRFGNPNTIGDEI